MTDLMPRFLILALICFLAACNPDKQKSVSGSEMSFATRDDTELFFKNVRQIFYEREVMQAAKLEIYRMKGRSQSAEYPLLDVAIVINWREDEAYINLQPQAFLENEDPLYLFVGDSLNLQTHSLNYRSKEDYRAFAQAVYQAILDNKAMRVKVQNDTLPYLDKEEDREVFRKTLVDYYRLVGAFDE
ncbi:hypothetical protein QWY31_09710 [Cytophagales bacterium LB-30]|uniref:Lipoprotein n=1 Tax=Shiella aurantiaca TaxID=3058365 RepID=A0ABT8F674_9BACT|nr:hypothetical protein [Shiella aurantiaca]MDN4165779.1 hypothetical protein [Shiella aurantiaca]